MRLPGKKARVSRTQSALAALLLLPVFLCFPCTSMAERTRESCDAVSELAEIDYDTRLIVTILKHANKDICIFRVGLGPSGAAQETGAQTALQFQWLYRSGQDSNFTELVSKDLTPWLQRALVEPLEDARFLDERKSIETAIAENAKVIDECVTDAILKREISFEKRNDVIACGLAKSIFVLQATYGAITVALFVPAQ